MQQDRFTRINQCVVKCIARREAARQIRDNYAEDMLGIASFNSLMSSRLCIVCMMHTKQPLDQWQLCC